MTCRDGFICTTMFSVNQIGVLPWIMVVCGLWFLLFVIYKAVFQALLKKLQLNPIAIEKLVPIYWQFCFTTITLPCAFKILSVNFVGDTTNNNFGINIFDWIKQNQEPSIESKLSCVILAGYYLNNLCQICIKNGYKNFEFFAGEIFIIFFLSTFSLRCIHFGIATAAVFNTTYCLLEAAKMLHCFSVICNSKILKYITGTIVIIYLCYWSVIFFYIIPNYFIPLFDEMTQNSPDKNIFLLKWLFKGSFLMYYLTDMCTSPLFKLMINFITQKQISLEYLLFEIKIDKNFNGHSDSKKTSDAMSDERIRQLKTNENLNSLYQTVKCYIRIKKKLTRIRTKLKEKNENQNLNSDCKSNTSCQENDLNMRKCSNVDKIASVV